MSALPLDVLAKIIDELDPRNAADAMALRSFSLSCHAVLSFAQKALFAKISLLLHSHNPIPSWTQVVRLRDMVLGSSPHIACYIRAFRVALAVHEVQDLKRIDPVLQELATVLPGLENLQQFELRYTLWRSSTWQVQCLDWPTLNARFRRAVEAVVKSPSLVHFCLGRIKNFPLRILMGHARLIDLDIEQPHVIDIKIIHSLSSNFDLPESKTDTDSWLSRRQVRVRSYTIGEGSVGVWPFGGDYCIDERRPDVFSVPGFDYEFDCSEMQNLTVFWRYPSHVRKTQLAIPFSPSLQVFSCTIHNKEVSFCGLARTLLMRPLPNLTTLRLSTTKYFRLSRHDDPFYSLPEELTLLSGQNVLEEISISLTFESVARTIGNHHLQLLDKPFSRKGFPFLRFFRLEMNFWSPAGADFSQTTLSHLNIPHKYIAQLVTLRSMPGLIFSCSAELY